MLSRRLGEAQDGLAKTTAKSKDLFSTLSMLPGPVGQFFSQLQGGIELLKTFSSFTFKDLAFQFGETADDIADIGKNLSNVDGETFDSVTESADGKPSTEKGRWTDILMKKGDKWMLVGDHGGEIDSDDMRNYYYYKAKIKFIPRDENGQQGFPDSSIAWLIVHKKYDVNDILGFIKK
jgi:hypothetical protein